MDENNSNVINTKIKSEDIPVLTKEDVKAMNNKLLHGEQKSYDDYEYAPTFGATSFSELKYVRRMQQATRDVASLIRMFNELAYNILFNKEIDTVVSMKSLMSEFSKEVELVFMRQESMDEKENKPKLVSDTTKAVQASSLKRGDLINWTFPGDAGVGIVIRILKNGSFTSDASNTTMDATEEEPVIVIEQLERVDDKTYKRTGILKPKRVGQINHFRDVNVVKMFTGEELKELELNEFDNIPGWFSPVYSAKDILFYKDSQNNLKFFGIYSNKFEDREKEILSEDAHKEFIDAIDNGLATLPKLQLWHINKDLGEVKQLIWSEYGFVIFAGEVYKEFEQVVEKILAKANKENVELGCSHGFHILERDGAVITKYRSKEISFLPLEAAANILTTFSKKELNDE